MNWHVRIEPGMLDLWSQRMQLTEEVVVGLTDYLRIDIPLFFLRDPAFPAKLTLQYRNQETPSCRLRIPYPASGPDAMVVNGERQEFFVWLFHLGDGLLEVRGIERPLLWGLLGPTPESN